MLPFLWHEMAFKVGVESPEDLVDLLLMAFSLSILDQFVHEPGPMRERSTGSKIMPWKVPSMMTKKIILKKVTKR